MFRTRRTARLIAVAAVTTMSLGGVGVGVAHALEVNPRIPAIDLPPVSTPANPPNSILIPPCALTPGACDPQPTAPPVTTPPTTTQTTQAPGHPTSTPDTQFPPTVHVVVTGSPNFTG